MATTEVPTTLVSGRAQPTVELNEKSELLVYIVFGLSFYAPIALVLYGWNRHKPAIRYRNPREMGFTAASMILFINAKCVTTLYGDEIPCTTLTLFTGLPLQFAFIGFLLAKLRLVLTFRLTELTVAYTENKGVHSRSLKRLRAFLSPRASAIAWIVTTILWNTPFIILVTIQSNELDYCPSGQGREVLICYSTEFCILFILSIILSCHLSHDLDNFNIGGSFRTSSRVVAFLFCFTMPALYYSDTDVVQEYALDLYACLLTAHAFLWIHIVQPVWRSMDYDPAHDAQVLHGTAAVLDAYLHTPEGFDTFCEFAKLEFMYECVVAWKAIVAYRRDTDDHMTTYEIYEQHLAEHAPLSVQSALPVSVWKRYQIAFASTSKYTIRPEEIHSDSTYYDVLFDAITAKLLRETLPHFQKHTLGAKWTHFVMAYRATVALNQVLDDVPSEFDSSVKRGIYIGTTKRMLPIQSEESMVEISEGIE
ncbi:hypothetical protein LEN26_020372 [Aphanomyces euteiches]|nr:hypothetical protein LEN26_020372 [Aphanomyces euteiches]KAH9129442.1 hypothetical protein AeMF1_000548 [Aphanomyces euteiches]KAH9196515.1 hypothetical protein AeNC1_001490 [Aphanomyces euteiches]